MKKLILTVASVVVLGGLLVAASVVHHSHVVANQKAQDSLQQQLRTLRVQATEQLSQLQAALQTEQAKASADKQALCAFITTHKLAQPATCTQ